MSLVTAREDDAEQNQSATSLCLAQLLENSFQLITDIIDPLLPRAYIIRKIELKEDYCDDEDKASVYVRRKKIGGTNQ